MQLPGYGARSTLKHSVSKHDELREIFVYWVKQRNIYLLDMSFLHIVVELFNE